MSDSKEAKDFRRMERAYRAAADAAGKVAAVLEDQNHSEDELAEALGMFVLRNLAIKAVSAP